MARSIMETRRSIRAHLISLGLFLVRIAVAQVRLSMSIIEQIIVGVIECMFAMCCLQVMAIAMAGLFIDTNGHDQLSVQGVQGALFILSAEVIFDSSYSVAHTYPTHLPILRRETGEHVYRLSAYYVSNIICLIPKHLIDAFSFLGIIYVFAGFANGLWLYLELGIILTATAINASAYGCMISGFFESARMTSEVAPPLDLFFLILGGVYINLSGFSRLKYTSLFFYSNEALAVTYWHGITEIGWWIFMCILSMTMSCHIYCAFTLFTFPISVCPPSYNGHCFRNGTEVLDSYSYRSDYSELWIDFVGMFALSTIMHAIGYLGVRRLTRKTGFLWIDGDTNSLIDCISDHIDFEQKHAFLCPIH